MKESIQKTKQLARTIEGSGRNQRVGFVDNRTNLIQGKISQVIQGAFINSTNSGARYPHLHTDHQYMGYTYIPGPGNHVEIRGNGGNINQSWLHDVGDALPGQWSAARQLDHQVILGWIQNHEPLVWSQRWH